MVVDTGRSPRGRQVLIPTTALERPDSKLRMIPVNLTVQKVKDSPDIETDKPVSHQHEAELRDYYESPFYWALGLESYVASKKRADPHLRSTRQVNGYRIHSTEGEIGQVEDFDVEDDTWEIRYIVVNTRRWLQGRTVLIHPLWIKEVSWRKSEVFVALSRDSIRNSPPFDKLKPVSRDYETRLFDHYGQPKYWEDKESTLAVPPGKSLLKRSVTPGQRSHKMGVEFKEELNGKLLDVRLTGELVKEDYEKFVPAVDRAVQQHGKIWMLVETHDFQGWTAGALWEDTKFALHHFRDIERLAVVGETKWEQGLATFCKPFTAAVVRYFDHTRATEARNWLVSRNQPTPAQEDSKPKSRPAAKPSDWETTALLADLGGDSEPARKRAETQLLRMG
jgi:SpoIIAA-like